MEPRVKSLAAPDLLIKEKVNWCVLKIKCEKVVVIEF